MSQHPKRARFSALYFASLPGIVAAAELLERATDRKPMRAPAGVDRDAEWDTNPRRPC